MAMEKTLVCESAAVTEKDEGARFNVDLDGQSHPGFVVRFNKEARAFVNRCPHVGTELDWQSGKFFDYSGLYLICATHGAVFLPDSGYCVGGPCKGQRLVRLPVIECDGNIFLTEGFHLYVE